MKKKKDDQRNDRIDTEGNGFYISLKPGGAAQSLYAVLRKKIDPKYTAQDEKGISTQTGEPVLSIR